MAPIQRTTAGGRSKRKRLGRVHPYLECDVEIRTVIGSTNGIESLNARYRRAVKARGYFPEVWTLYNTWLDIPSHASRRS